MAPRMTIKPATLALRATVGTCSAEKLLTLTNADKFVGIRIQNITLAHPDFVEFSIRNNIDCIGSLLPGKSCSASFVFCPTVARPQPDTIDIADDAAGNPHHVKISGIGTAPAAH